MPNVFLIRRLIERCRHAAQPSLSGLEPAAWSDAVTCVVLATGISTQKGRLVSAILFPTKLTFSYDIELGIVVGILAVPSVCVSNLECNLRGIWERVLGIFKRAEIFHM